MRTTHWLFIVSVALFLSGIALVIAGARPGAGASAVEAAPIEPVATVKQIMQGIMQPSALAVFNSVGTIITAAGVEEREPKTDEEWAVVGSHAAAMIESANLLRMDGRAIDQGDWMKWSQTLIDTTKVALKGIEAKDKEALFDSVEAINETCDNCHMKYQR